MDNQIADQWNRIGFGSNFHLVAIIWILTRIKLNVALRFFFSLSVVYWLCTLVCSPSKFELK